MYARYNNISCGFDTYVPGNITELGVKVCLLLVSCSRKTPFISIHQPFLDLKLSINVIVTSFRRVQLSRSLCRYVEH